MISVWLYGRAFGAWIIKQLLSVIKCLVDVLYNLIAFFPSCHPTEWTFLDVLPFEDSSLGRIREFCCDDFPFDTFFIIHVWYLCLSLSLQAFELLSECFGSVIIWKVHPVRLCRFSPLLIIPFCG